MATQRERTAQNGALSPVLPEKTKEAGERNSPVLRNRGPLAPTPLALQNLGRATLVEAKFTFLYGAWSGVQNLGSSKLRTVVVVDPPKPALLPAVQRDGGHSQGPAH